MKKNKIPVILGLAILTIGLIAGVFLVQNIQIFNPKASPESSPKDVRISNISDASFTISWTTDKKTQGFVKWGKTDSSLNQVAEDNINDLSFTHTATIRNLSTSTNYFFKIGVGETQYDNNGVAWQVKTGPKVSAPTKSVSISGTVINSTGEAAQNALVYVSMVGGTLASTITSQSGNWIIPISNIRSQNLNSFIEINETKSLVEISVNAGSGGLSSAQIFPKSAKPVPPIILGQIHDFRNAPSSEAGNQPTASIEFPENSSPSSGFKVGEKASTPSASSVTLDSIDQGEVVSTDKPEFFGEGPAGTKISIKVESEAVTDELTVGKDGSWKWSIPASLEVGTHKVTITWKDKAGIIRTLTRTFIVQASEGPAFESTPSASPTSPSATKAPSPSPSASASATPKASPTATPKASASATASATAAPIPETGSLTPTIVLFMMGISLLLASFFVWKYSEI